MNVYTLQFYVFIYLFVIYTSKSSSSKVEKSKKDLPLCKDTEYVNGVWLERNSIEKSKATKSFFCCMWDSRDYLKNKDICGPTNISSNFYHGSNEYITQGGGHACYCDKAYGRNIVHKREQYDWIPLTCRLHQWNAKHFCQILKDRIILLVGDSTMQQSASTIMSMIKSGDGGCAHQLILAHDWHFDSKRDGNNTFVSYVASILPDIVIVSAGPHFHSVNEFSNFFINKFLVQLKTLRKFQNLTNTKFIWRTNNPGHVNCTSTSPIKQYTPASKDSDIYKWNLHQTFDAIARNFRKIGNYSIIDMSPLYWRYDSHPGELTLKIAHINDCLHYCMPGPLDLFSVIVYNMLRNNEL